MHPGYRGCREAAASLARRGLAVTLVSAEDASQAGRLGDAAGQVLRAWLEDEGIALRLGAAAGGHLAVEHWGEALAMSRVAGLTAAGADASWAEVPGFWSTIGDRTLKYAAWGDGFDQASFVGHSGRGVHCLVLAAGGGGRCPDPQC